MRAVFIAGTDTGVGKTVVAGLLSRYLLEKGYRVVTQKWIETGRENRLSDIDIHLKYMRKKREEFEAYHPLMMPYVFKFAASPHLAGRLEKRRIDVAKIRKSLKALCKRFDYVIVEGIGGLLVPIDEKVLLIDVIKKFRLPVLIVAGNKLGAINHTLLSVEALKARNMKILGIIFNDISKDQKQLILKDNPEIVKRICGITVLGELPWMGDPYKLQNRFKSFGDKLIARL